MINYKSFKITDSAKLRVRADKIVATVSSKGGKSIDLYVEGLAMPLHVAVTEDSAAQIIDYIWERHSVEEGSDNV